MKLFGRSLKDAAITAELRDALDNIQRSTDFAEICLGINVACDDRVVADREDDFFEAFAVARGRPTDGLTPGQPIINALKAYVSKHVEVLPPRRPQFIDKSRNQFNILENFSKLPEGGDTLLATIIDLTSMAGFYAGRVNSIPYFEDLKSLGKDREKQIENWLDLRTREPDLLMENMLAAHDLLLKNGSRRPVWVALWNNLEPVANGPAERWMEVVGVTRQPARWQAVLTYPAREAGTLVRPTQLEAGDYRCHFPSPGFAACLAGGHPMHLQMRGTPMLIPEFIHEQIPRPLNYWTQKRLIGKTTIGTRGPTQTQRHQHYKQLSNNLDPIKVREWMPKAF